MGKRGPRPTPTNLRVIRGDKRKPNKDEPVPPSGDVRPPDWLRPEAVEVWNRLAPDLIRKKLLTPWDVDAFAVLCNAIIQHQEATKFVTNAGVMVRGRKEAVVKNPAVQLVRDSAQIIRAYAQEFGLTPSARSSIKMPNEPGDDEADRLLS